MALLPISLDHPLRLDVADGVIRPFQPSDRDAIVRHANNWNVARNMRDRFPHPYTVADAEAWLALVPTQSPTTNFAIATADELTGELIGGIGIELQTDVFRRGAELGYWVGESYWGRGIATAAVRAFTRYAFEAHDLLRIFAGVFSWNPGSMRVLEKAGYVREGILRQSVVKDGQVLDKMLYAVTRDSTSQ
jgi:[ribosomal protein S5]-alanine N-acetyltransferase